MTVRACAVVPTRNHYRALPAIVAALRGAGLPVVVVDDGSDEPAHTAIAKLHDAAAGVSVHRLSSNQGKGGAVVAGFRWALAAGYTHALQIDADGQHDTGAIPALIALAARHPQAVIVGAATYGATVPAARRWGRWLTHVWVFIETLSLRITDSMCGMRVYPLAAVERLLATATVGSRMDFDTDILVRLFWAGVPPIMVPVRVTYPPDNTSNFDLWRDNWRITRMHTRLVLTMLGRLTTILRHRPPRTDADRRHWAVLAERGAYWGLRFLSLCCRLLGRRGCLVVMAPIVFYFYVTAGARRRASLVFLSRAFAAQGRSAAPGWWDGYLHFLSFARRALDAFAAWVGLIDRTALVSDDPASVAIRAADPRGRLLVVSHFGNSDLSRALLAPELRDRITVLVHTRHARNYNRLIRRFRPDVATRLVEVTDIGPEIAIQLKARIERGEWVAIAGDRVPVSSGSHTVTAPFLGHAAPFSQGPWILAALLDCPVDLLFCRRDGDSWMLSIEPFADQVTLPRGRRQQAITTLAGRYAARLETHCLRDPYQWGNFFDFWAAERRE